ARGRGAIARRRAAAAGDGERRVAAGARSARLLSAAHAGRGAALVLARRRESPLRSGRALRAVALSRHRHRRRGARALGGRAARRAGTAARRHPRGARARRAARARAARGRSAAPARRAQAGEAGARGRGLEDRKFGMTPLDGARLERVDVGGAELACWVAGDDGAPLVICAHGFPDCARSFRAQIPALVGAGHRVVAPYLRGYSPSTTARDERYHAAALAADLCALARHYSPGAPAALVGHDWGAIAAYAACALAPSLFSRLCTIAVPHLRAVAAHGPSRAQLARSWYIGLFQLPLIAEQRLTAENFALIDRLWRDWSPGFSAPAAELDEVKASMAGTEHVRAVLAYYR